MNKSINIICVATLSLLSFGGCGIYSKFQAPTSELSQVDSLYNYIEASEATTSLASLSWRELFTDPYLQTLIERGLEQNTDLRVAHLSVAQAEIVLSKARQAFIPSLSLAPSGYISSQGGAPATKSYTASLSASWEVDIFGKLRNAKEQSRASLEQSRAYSQAVQTELVASIASSYYSLLTLDRQLEITRRTEVLWGENLRAMEALMRAGRINRSSVLQSQASAISLKTTIAGLEQQIREVEISLSTLLALPSTEIERGSLEELTLPEDISVGVPLQLITNRPDIRVAEYNLAEAFYATGEARSSLYPSITLSGSAGYTQSGVGAIFSPGEMIYSAAASLLQPIYARGTLRAQLKISQSQQEQAMLQFTQTILDAGAEVNSALTGWQSAREILEHQVAEIEVLGRAVRASELLMRSGEANYLEVLTAQQSLLQGELSYSNNKYSEIESVVELYRALGGGQ